MTICSLISTPLFRPELTLTFHVFTYVPTYPNSLAFQPDSSIISLRSVVFKACPSSIRITCNAATVGSQTPAQTNFIKNSEEAFQVVPSQAHIQKPFPFCLTLSSVTLACLLLPHKVKSELLEQRNFILKTESSLSSLSLWNQQGSQAMLAGSQTLFQPSPGQDKSEAISLLLNPWEFSRDAKLTQFMSLDFR